jgi:hypothetical protein
MKYISAALIGKVVLPAHDLVLKMKPREEEEEINTFPRE